MFKIYLLDSNKNIILSVKYLASFQLLSFNLIIYRTRHTAQAFVFLH